MLGAATGAGPGVCACPKPEHSGVETRAREGALLESPGAGTLLPGSVPREESGPGRAELGWPAPFPGRGWGAAAGRHDLSGQVFRVTGRGWGRGRQEVLRRLLTPHHTPHVLPADRQVGAGLSGVWSHPRHCPAARLAARPQRMSFPLGATGNSLGTGAPATRVAEAAAAPCSPRDPVCPSDGRLFGAGDPLQHYSWYSGL